MAKNYFENYRIDPDTHYFIYIGELKNYGLNNYLKQAMSRIHKRPVDFIAVVPDVLNQYDYENIIVINPVTMVKSIFDKQRYSCRVSAPVFMQAVSENPHIVRLIHRLLEQQDHLYLYMYESLPEMTLDSIPGVSILGPKSQIARRWNNKIYQYKTLSAHVPIPDWKVCQGMEALYLTTKGLWEPWEDGIFVTTPFSAAGMNSVIAHSFRDITGKFSITDQNYLISRFLPHAYDPTILALAANENDIYIAGIADQRIEGGNRFTGSTFPSALPQQTQEQLYTMTRKIGRIMASEGYRGIFGCDYIVDEQGRIHFLEVNARKQGTTLEFCCTLEKILPAECPILPELEYIAVTQNRLPRKCQEVPPGLDPGLCWGTYNYKLTQDVSVCGFMPATGGERNAFSKVYQNRLSRNYIVLEHIGNDFVIAKGSFLGRIVAVGKTMTDVIQGLDQGKKLLESTIDNH